jgi:deoxyribodipyrimidine photo-lyase
MTTDLGGSVRVCTEGVAGVRGDDAILGSGYLAQPGVVVVDAPRDLDAALKRLGTDGLVIRRGDPTAEVAALAEEVGAHSVHLSADWSGYAQRRRGQLGKRLGDDRRVLVLHNRTLAVVPPGVVAPSDKDHFAVLTPYHRRRQEQHRRPVLDPPQHLSAPRARAIPRSAVPGRTGAPSPRGRRDSGAPPDASAAEHIGHGLPRPP